jgi:putative PIN family toxin of toxin-antitoxin system
MAKNIRIVIDTNWYVSGTINRKSRRVLFELLTGENFVILLSNEILAEYRLVISREKFKKIIKTAQVTRFINLVMSKVTIVQIKSSLTGSRDPKDNFLLSLCSDNSADFLISGDNDLLVLETTGATRIVTLHDFLEITSQT